MRSKRVDRWIVLSLVAALAIEIALLLWHLGVISWHSNAQAQRQGPAGIIAKNENDLRRRSIDSLVWEKSTVDETVFFYDSLLTLAQSSALVRLEQDAEVELAENTLVTIEPAELSSSGEIRLKFVRGNLQARNPWTNTHIAAPDFVVDLKAGSEMHLRQTGEDEFEVRISKGEATVLGQSGSHELNSAQLLRMNQGKGEALDLDTGLEWVTPPPARIYSHADSNEIQLRWEGEASELRLQKTGEAEQVFPLDPHQREVKLTMGHGDHLAYLRSDNRTSAPLKLQLWRAPLLHLIMPLPRNRVRTHETTFFLWTRIPEASNYVFKLKGANSNSEEERISNSHQVNFSSEDDVEWSVWGRDSEGFSIPPLYQYPLYIRDTPFAPPTLNAPRVRKPAQATDKGASHWILNLLLPMAHADEDARYEATFSWQPVAGANQYLIEISETADFRRPAVSMRTAKTEFVWRDFRDRVYFWRVAAGNRSGRMGVFSEPAQVSITEGVEVRKIEVADAPQAIPTEPQPAPVPVQTQPIADSASVAEPRLHEPRGLRVFWLGGYGTWQTKTERNVNANLSGVKAFSFAVERDFLVAEESWWTAEGKYSSSSFKPESTVDYPFQDEVSVQNIEIRITRSRAASPWGFGFSAALMPKIERADYERIRAVLSFIGGAHVRGLWSVGRAEYQADFGLNAGSGEFGLSSSHRLLSHWRRLYTGFGVQGLYLIQGAGSTLSADAFVTLGFEF